MGNSIQSFGPLECLNPSIIDAMGHCSRIRKNVTDGEQRTDCERSAQWEKLAEVTPGHSLTVKGNESQDSYDLVRQYICI